MVILGGLEIVAGGYLVHRYHKKQKKKKRLVEETQQRRDNAFSAAKLQPCHTPQLSQPTPTTEQKYGYVANASPSRPAPPFPPLHRPYTEPPPHRPHHAPQVFQSQQFMIPRRPVPTPYNAPLPNIIQPLQRADSCATISRMPVANGYRPTQGANDHQLPPHRANLQLLPVSHSHVNSPYGNHGFAVSSPALGNQPTTPTSNPGMHGGRYTVDDNWETYNQAPGRPTYAPSVSTALGEHRDDDPPPPYHP